MRKMLMAIFMIAGSGCVPEGNGLSPEDSSFDAGRDDPCYGNGVTYYKDHDHDGFGLDNVYECRSNGPDTASEYTAVLPGDCLDSNSLANPGQVERCGNGVDDDCDGYTDESSNQGGCYSQNQNDVDNDGDGYTENEGDCNDSDPYMAPGTQEICGNGKDDDCDGYTDESGTQGGCQGSGSGSGTTTCFLDQDDDGYRTQATLLSADDDCDDPSEAYSYEPDADCDDHNNTVHPGAPELCDGLDNDCDSAKDESCTGGYLGGGSGSGTCSSTQSKTQFTYSAPSGAIVDRVMLGVTGTSINGITWAYVSSGNPSGVSLSMSGNTATFSYDRCVDDGARWTVSVEYHYSGGSTQYSCVGSSNPTLSGSWNITHDGYSDSPEVDDWGAGCNTAWTQ